MPNFSCGGEGCRGISCRDCTPGELVDRYWQEMEIAIKNGEHQSLSDRDYEKRARDWWERKHLKKAATAKEVKSFLKRVAESKSVFSSEAAQLLKDIS